MKYKNVYKNLEIKVSTFKKMLNTNTVARLSISSLDDLSLNYFQIMSIIKNAKRIGTRSNGTNIGTYNTIYVVDDLVFKFSNEFINSLKSFKEIKNRYFNESIEDLMEKKKRYQFKYNSLPVKIIRYKGNTVGILYEYHKDYSSLINLINEDYETIFNVFTRLNLLLRELAKAGIYYKDFKLDNILYKDSDVKIIDFDSPENGNIITSDGKIFKMSIVPSFEFGERENKNKYINMISSLNLSLIKILRIKLFYDVYYKDKNKDDILNEIRNRLILNSTKQGKEKQKEINDILARTELELISNDYMNIKRIMELSEYDRELENELYLILDEFFYSDDYKKEDFIDSINRLSNKINKYYKKDNGKKK